MHEAEATESRRLVHEKQQLLKDGDDQLRALKAACGKASEAESKLSDAEEKLRQADVKWAKIQAYAQLKKKERDAAHAGLAEAENKLLDVRAELAQLRKGTNESAEVKQAMSERFATMSERLKATAAENKGLRQEVLELKRKRPAEEPLSHACKVVVAEPVGREMEALKKANVNLSAKVEEFAKKNTILSAQVEELTTKNTDLGTQVEVLTGHTVELENQLARIHRLSRV